MVQTAARPGLQAARRFQRLPPWPRGPKPKRRTELGLLLFGACITTLFYVIAEVGAKNKIPADIGPILGIIVGLSLAAHVINRWLVPNSNAVVLPLIALLNGIGYVVIVRWNPPEAKTQASWVALGVLLYAATLIVVRHPRDLDRYRYLLLLVAGILLVAPLVPKLGETIQGARLWVHVGPIKLQPIEFSKIALVIFFASYFAENKELLSIPSARVGDRLVLDPRPLLPILVAWGLAMAIIGLENDVGFAMLLFTVFVGLLWISTGRWVYLIFSAGIFAAGTYAAIHIFSQVHVRISLWLNLWNNQTLAAGQLKAAWYAMGSGGVGGVGLGLDHASGKIPQLTSDMIFAAIGNEMGFIGAAVVVLAFILLVGAGLRIAQTGRSDFAKLLATGLTMVLGFQAFFIMAGIVRLLPLTGITLPFVAYGGSSLLANYILIGVLMRVSEDGATSVDELAPGDRAFVRAT